MVKMKPRNFECKECGRLTYSFYANCLNCGSEGSVDVTKEREGQKLTEEERVDILLQSLSDAQRDLLKNKLLDAK